MRKNPKRTRRHPLSSTAVLDDVPPKILHALRISSANLTKLKIRHAICGGVAVGAYGHVRATKDVDYLVGDEAFIRHGGLVTFAPGVSYAVDDIPTDVIPLESSKPHENLRFLEGELDDPFDLDGLPLLSPEALITMKLVAHRVKDLDDVRHLIDLGATTRKAMHAYLRKHGRSDLQPWLDRALIDL